ncbi:hypothetical protein ACLOJK_031169 [Asimina triloba]
MHAFAYCTFDRTAMENRPFFSSTKPTEKRYNVSCKTVRLIKDALAKVHVGKNILTAKDVLQEENESIKRLKSHFDSQTSPMGE